MSRKSITYFSLGIAATGIALAAAGIGLTPDLLGPDIDRPQMQSTSTPALEALVADTARLRSELQRCEDLQFTTEYCNQLRQYSHTR